MSTPQPIDLSHATRLMRAGRLQDATAAIRQALGADRAAPDAGPPDPHWVSDTYRGPQGDLDYRLYRPASTGAEPPLLVMLHGCSQTAEDFAAGSGMNRLAERHGWLVAYPQQSAVANPSRCWNWFRAADQQRNRGEAALLAGLTRQVLTRHAAAPGRVYVAGLSAGGAMAAVLAAAYPELYAGAGVHSGLACGSAGDLSSALLAMRQGPGPLPPATGQTFVPLIVFHGDRDVTVNPRNGDYIIAQGRASLRAAGIETQTLVKPGHTPDGRRYTRTRHVDRRGAVMLEHWALHGAGHAWSGGSPEGSHTDPQGPDAAAEMVRFFAALARH